MLLLFSKGRSLPARTQPLSPLPPFAVLLSPCLLDLILNKLFILFDTSSSFAAACGDLDKDFFLFVWIEEMFHKASLIRHWNKTPIYFPKQVLSFPLLPFPVCLCCSTHSCIVSFSCLFRVSTPLLPYFPSLYKSLPVRPHISPAPDCVGRKIKCCQSCAREN